MWTPLKGRREGRRGSAATSLRAEGVRVHFEGVKAIDGVDLLLKRREILGLIGPNGAGKTTLVNALSGFQRLTAGSVFLGPLEVSGASPDRLCRRGLVRTFQNVRTFGRLSVYENVELGAATRGLPRARVKESVWQLLDRFGLADKATSAAASLPHGEERRLGIARALATQPAFLLLDEPAAGLDERESDELLGALSLAPDEFDVGLFVIEHDMRLIMRLCERIQVLDRGRTIAIGSPAEIRADPLVLSAYLGTDGDADAGH